MIARTLARLILIPLGLLLAAFAAGGVLLSLGQERLITAMQATGGGEEALFGMLGFLLKLMLSAFSVQAVLVPVLAVIVGEVAGIRRAAYYVAAGGLGFAVIPLLARLAPGDGFGTLSSTLPIFATAGFAGGFVYWLVAGRTAGNG